MRFAKTLLGLAGIGAVAAVVLRNRQRDTDTARPSSPQPMPTYSGRALGATETQVSHPANVTTGSGQTIIDNAPDAVAEADDHILRDMPVVEDDVTGEQSLSDLFGDEETLTTDQAQTIATVQDDAAAAAAATDYLSTNPTDMIDMPLPEPVDAPEPAVTVKADLLPADETVPAAFPASGDSVAESTPRLGVPLPTDIPTDMPAPMPTPDVPMGDPDTDKAPLEDPEVPTPLEDPRPTPDPVEEPGEPAPIGDPMPTPEPLGEPDADREPISMDAGGSAEPATLAANDVQAEIAALQAMAENADNDPDAGQLENDGEDRTITDRIRSSIGREPELASLPKININTQANGVVYLRGTVPDMEKRDLVQLAAEMTDGVTQVVNELEVESQL